MDILKTVFPEIPKIESLASKDFEEGLGKKGTHFFKIRNDPGDVIMSNGAFIDYAAIRLSGAIGVYQESAPGGEVGSTKDVGCLRATHRSISRRSCCWPGISW